MSGLRLTFKHLPGENNEWADALSRLAQPGAGARIPAPLLGVARTPVEERGASFWITGNAPSEILEASVPGGRR